MKLTSAEMLEGVVVALRDRIAPGLADEFARDAARIAGALIAIAARAGDDAVAIRVEENARMRRIFADAARIVGDEDFAARLKQAAASADPGLKVSELDAETGRLRALLVELHSWLEDADGADVRRLDRAIWCAIRDAEMARAPRA